MLREIVDDTFLEEVTSSTLPVLVLSYASWCVDSQRMIPIFKTLSNLPEFCDIRFVQVEVEQNRKTKEKLGTIKFPTLYLFINGTKAEEKIAEVSATQQEKIIRSFAQRAKDFTSGGTV